jgi:purine-binding chemotaxis protein CheW
MSDVEDTTMLLDDEDIDTQANKFLVFHIGEEDYGIAIEHVTEIIELQKITEVPDMPDYVKGVINLRGKVIPVIDLRLRFEMEARDYDDRTCIIIVNINDTAVGFIVDTVAEVHDILEKDIEPPPMFKTASGHERYISGMGKVGDDVKILIDVSKLIYEDEIEEIKQKI